MPGWPAFPIVYEINTWVWLSELSTAAGRKLNLAEVPDQELERIAGYGFDGVWLMGVWQRSRAARTVSRTHPAWQDSFQETLPGCSDQDISGSPYAILDYLVDPALGGDRALERLRARLWDLNLRLVLDFVPNHMALDHDWLISYPARLVQGTPQDLDREPANYYRAAGEQPANIFAHGRDPYFDGWPDTVQLDYRQPETRRAMSDILLSVAERCDGLRVDMAMLVMNGVFTRTWGGEIDTQEPEFWSQAISELRARHPEFLMLAEVYWDMEDDLLQMGFDYCYDKPLYDRLLDGEAGSVRRCVEHMMALQPYLARFIENHDEQRAAAAFGIERSRVAAVAALTLPGLRLLHEGQLEGRQVRLPVHLGRRPDEEPLESMEQFYRSLLEVLGEAIFHQGAWQLIELVPAAQGDLGFEDAICYQWVLDDQICLVMSNLSNRQAEFLLPIQLTHTASPSWRLQNLMGEPISGEPSGELYEGGLRFDLPGYGFSIFSLVPGA
jgi:hypothetical protein